MDSFTLRPVALARTPFHEKFGIPRQSGLVAVPAVIELLPPFDHADAVSGLELVSHLWLTFVFSENLDSAVRLKVRPPRLGGNKKIGVFATRSSFRPNAIGQSLVRLERIEINAKAILLHVSGIDLLDGTPLLDIKPYLPYADHVPGAVNALAPQAPDRQRLQVQWSVAAVQSLQHMHGQQAAAIQQWITEILQLDPRPAYKTADVQSDYGMALFNMNIRWHMPTQTCAEVLSATPLQEQ